MRREALLCLVLPLISCSPRLPGARGEVGVFVEDAAVSGTAAPTLAPSSDSSLRPRIEDITGVELAVLTVGCVGSCAELVAAASGGNPPYSYRWADGVASRTRRVCPEVDGQLTVSVSDTAIEDPEFGYDGQTANAAITTDVIQCTFPDAGSGEPDVGPDAGAAPPDPSVCQHVRVTRESLTGCQNLTLSAECWRPIGANPSRTYDLPFPLQPGGHHCLVAFGNAETMGNPTLQIHLAASVTNCIGRDEVLDGANDAYAPNIGTSGQVFCIADTVNAYQKISVTLDATQGSWGDLELQLCETCPM